MHFGTFVFGSLPINGVTYTHDVVIDRGKIRKRKKKPSRPFRGSNGHTPLTTAEAIPWKCRRLVIGTGANGALPILDDVKHEAQRRGIALVIAPTIEVIEELTRQDEDTNAILHVTC